MRRIAISSALLLLGIAIGATGLHAVQAKQPSRTMLLTVDLPEIPGKEMRLFITDLPPGSATTKHRHPGHLVAYMESGSVVQRRDGYPDRTIKTGTAWEEPPGEIHIGMNGSKTKPARLIGAGIFDKGAPLSITVP